MSYPAATGLLSRSPTEKSMASASAAHHVDTRTPGKDTLTAAALADLRRLERLFADCKWPERRAFVHARRRAREHALAVLESGFGEVSARTALLAAATDLFGALRFESAACPQDEARLVEQLEDVIGLSRLALAREVLRSPEPLNFSPSVAVEVQLGTLMAFAPLRSVSLWTPDVADRIRCTSHAGHRQPSRGAQQLARRLLAGECPEPGERRLLIGLAVGQPGQPAAALVGCANPGGRELCRALLGEAGPMLDAVVQRGNLLTENVASARALVEASERKLTRLGFDLHDGPIQDVAMIAEDLRLFRDQLELVLGPPKHRKLVRGRIEDLDAQLIALDTELRRLSSEVQAASVLLNKPFRAALRDRVQAFTARTSIKPRLTLAGDMSMLSTSQQIALLNIIHEALSNIREHAEATSVEITVSAGSDGVMAKVTDNGQGFDLEPTLMRAARDGRTGLLSMNERVRLLGGHCRIETRRGGPTIVLVLLEPWLPLRAEPQPSRVSA